MNLHSHLSEEEKLQREKVVFANAMKQVESYLDGMTFNRNRVMVKHITPSAVPQHNELKDAHSKPTQSATALWSRRFYDKYMFMMTHTDRNYGTLVFKPCQEQSCDHCSALGNARKPERIYYYI